jgi:hypothetical protein
MDLKVSFSHEERLKFVRERFRAGLVVKLFCEFTKPPKFKRSLIVSTHSERPLFFIINTEPTEFAKQNARLRDQHKPIVKQSNPFMKHDSFVDCSTAHDNFDLVEIEEALANDTSLILGSICSETAALILESIAESSTLSRVHINQIGMEISQSI